MARATDLTVNEDGEWVPICANCGWTGAPTPEAHDAARSQHHCKASSEIPA